MRPPAFSETPFIRPLFICWFSTLHIAHLCSSCFSPGLHARLLLYSCQDSLYLKCSRKYPTICRVKPPHKLKRCDDWNANISERHPWARQSWSFPWLKRLDRELSGWWSSSGERDEELLNTNPDLYFQRVLPGTVSWILNCGLAKFWILKARRSNESNPKCTIVITTRMTL